MTCGQVAPKGRYDEFCDATNVLCFNSLAGRRAEPRDRRPGYYYFSNGHISKGQFLMACC
jgi:hypothetical protein